MPIRSLMPQLLPSARWARIALLLLMLFAFARSVLWASVQPGWLAPDEDYHWLYVNYLVEKGAFPSLSGPFYTAELYEATLLTHQGLYLSGHRTDYSGSGKAELRHLNRSRVPAPPSMRPVLHPPGYYVAPVLIDNLLWNRIAPTRLLAMRYYSALLGALTIFFAWLLAAQVLAREWQQLAAAAIASLQPILAFSASTVTNDAGVAATLTATLAWCAWMLRGPPRARQGIGLGVLFGVSIMVKATNLSQAFIIAFTLAGLWRAYPEARRELRGMLKWVLGIPTVIAGWWYVRLVIVTHSILGERGSLTAAHGAHGPGILHAPSVAWQWIASVYRGYWLDYLTYEVTRQNLWFWLPAAGAAVVAAGVGLLVRRTRAGTPGTDRAELRIVHLVVLAAMLLVIPPFALDVLRGIRGLPFVTQQGRFLVPAFPGLAVLVMLALRELTRSRRGWALPVAAGAFVAFDFVFYWHTWVVWVLERFYGPIHGDWLGALRHASYDKPAFVTQAFLAVLAVVAVAAFVTSFGVTVGGALRSAGVKMARPGTQRHSRHPRPVG